MELEREVEDYAGLVALMGRLIAVKERQPATDALFDEMRATIDVISAYGQQLPEATHRQLDELPEKWESTKKRVRSFRTPDTFKL